MKSVEIISKIVGRGGAGAQMASTGGSIDLSRYALKSELSSLEQWIAEFIEGDDADDIINRWKDIVSFVEGFSESDNLLTTLGLKADKTELSKYIPIEGYTDVLGEKNFAGGLKVNGSPIIYDTEKKCWKLEGDLIVTGGVAMYASDLAFNPSTIMDGVIVDNVTIIKQDGKLVALGGSGSNGSVADQVEWGNVLGKPSWITDTTPSISVSGVSVSLGGSITQSALRTALGLGSNAYTSTSYLPSSSYTASDVLAKILTVDGAGSGLDADLLDGKHYSDIINGNVASATRIQAYTHDSGDKVLLSGTRSDNTYERCIYDNGWGLMLKRSLTNTSSYIATLDDNVASATKLATARTIWGQSFDGTGNVSGYLENANFIMSNNEDGYFVGNRKDGVGSSDGGLLLFSYGNNPMSLFTNSLERIRITPTGNVGIGTITPLKTFHVVGDTYLQGVLSVNKYAQFEYVAISKNTDNASRIGSFDHYGGFVIQFGADNRTENQRFEVIDKNWSIALLALDTNGNLKVAGGITMYSDIRKKTKLKDVVLSLKDIANAPLIEHYYNSDDKKTTHVGSIAQYWAGLNDWFCKLDNEGYYTMEVQNAALASAISIARELDRYESSTDKRIKALEDENKKLKEEIEILKWNIA